MKKNILVICMDYKLGMSLYFESVCSCLELDSRYNIHKVILVDKLFEAQSGYENKIESQSSQTVINWGKTFFSKFLNIFFPYYIDSEILELIKNIKPDIAFIIYDCYFLNNIKKINKICSTLLVVHDLVLHPKKRVDIKTSLLNALLNSRAKRKRFQANALLTHSEAQHKKLQEMYNSKLNFLASMPNHITDEILQGKNLLPELKNVKNYILFFGRIEEYKGLDYLIQAYKNNEYLVENAKLVIAGCGKINNFECGIDQIIFINRYINNNEIRPLMENARVAVFPYTSSTQSSPPIIAACFGVPSIVTNIDGLREHVNDGKNGFVVPPRDIPGLQRSILAILQNDILYKSMIESQLLHYKNNHSIEKINRDYISIIEKVSI